MPNSLEQRIDIKVGLTRPRTERAATPRLCIVGISPPDAPWLGDLFPEARVKTSRMNLGGTEAVEQLRFSARSESGDLPHIASAYPSRIRDAFRLALNAGAPEVDLLLARARGVMPWDLDNREIADMMGPFLGEMPGAVLVYPDAGGPWPNNQMGLVSTWDRMVRLRDTIRNFQERWTDHYQLGVMDMVQGSPSENRQILLGIAGADVSLCHWTGTRDDMRSHGWRPACAALGGYLASKGEDVTQGIVGQEIQLGTGRYFVRSRAVDLGQRPLPPVDSVVSDTCVMLEMLGGGQRAEVMSAPTFRRPLGEWTISSVRTVKLIHQRLVQASDMFVFRPAQEMEASALGANIELALRPFYERGIVVGPDGSGAPVVNAGVVRSQTEPGLYADLMAQVRPWCQQVSVRVMVKMGDQPALTES